MNFVRSLKTIKGTLMWLLVAMYYFYEMVLRASSGVLANDFMETFHIQATQLGILSAVYGYAYSGLQIPCGILLDKIGVRYLVSISCAFCGFGALLLGTAYYYPVAIFGRVCIGIGSACAFISTLRLIVEWFDIKNFPLMAGLTNAIGCLGGLCASYPLSKLVNIWGWRMALCALSGFGLLLAAIIFGCVRDRPKQNVHEGLLEEERENNDVGFVESQKKSLFSVFLTQASQWVSFFLPVIKSAQVWGAGLIGAFLYAPLVVFAEAWGVPFLQTAYGVTSSVASNASMAMYVFFSLGSVLVLPLCQRWKSYWRAIVWATPIISAGLGMIALCSGIVPFFVVIFLCAGIGTAMGAQVLVFTLANQALPSKFSGTASALTNTIIMGLSYVMQEGFGRVMDYFWDQTKSAAGTPMYGTTPYVYALLFLSGMTLLAFLGFIFLKSDYPKTEQDE
ncbi:MULTISPECIES: MFS transporter [Holospora]|uniref:Lysosomal dipeptide transporter MFSD1 n=2 Tax=Holospora TaxID=44747 RepID=A0A061JHN3_9PROT|nr:MULTISPECIES: MFS transporter [Holospora]ETZ04873.1 L-galactonate transporter [Holospora undulata HU1]GAJ46718.1 L-galactonate transporter [Holospora elegans E1]